MTTGAYPIAVNHVTNALQYAGELFARNSADQDAVNNSAVLVDSTGLSVEVTANKRYLLDLVMLYDTAAAADFKAGLVYPAGATGWWASSPIKNAADSATTFTYQDISAVLTPGGVAAGTLLSARIMGHILVAETGGTLKVQHAQNTANVSDTILKAESYLRLQEVA